jgi:hypothetical protein
MHPNLDPSVTETMPHQTLPIRRPFHDPSTSLVYLIKFVYAPNKSIMEISICYMHKSNSSIYGDAYIKMIKLSKY